MISAGGRVWLRQVRSALFVDFDNVVGTPATRALGNHIDAWMAWLEDGRFTDDGRKRRIVAKHVYWNWGNENKYRARFERQGFSVSVCLSRAKDKKSAADMMIALDALQLSLESPRIEEFILLTADTDFVPLLDRLADRSKRTVAMVKDAASVLAYNDHADVVIDASKLGGSFTYRRPAAFSWWRPWRGVKSEPVYLAGPVDPDAETALPRRPKPASTPPTPKPRASQDVTVEQVVYVLLALASTRPEGNRELGRKVVLAEIRKRLPAFRNDGKDAYLGRGSYEGFVQLIAQQRPDAFHIREMPSGGICLVAAPDPNPPASHTSDDTGAG